MLPPDNEINSLFNESPLILAAELLKGFPSPPATVNLANLRGELDSPTRPPSPVDVSRRVAEALHVLVIGGYVAPALENWNPSPLWVFVTSTGTEARARGSLEA